MNITTREILIGLGILLLGILIGGCSFYFATKEADWERMLSQGLYRPLDTQEFALEPDETTPVSVDPKRYGEIANLASQIDPGDFTLERFTDVYFGDRNGEPTFVAEYSGTTTVTGELTVNDMLGSWCINIVGSEVQKVPRVRTAGQGTSLNETWFCFDTEIPDLAGYPNLYGTGESIKNVTATIVGFNLKHNTGTESANTTQLIRITPYSDISQ